MSKLISVFILIFPIMIIAFTIVDFQSEPIVNYDNEKISIKAPLCSEESIYYSDINEVNYINQFDFGKKVKGQFNKNYTAGWFNNTEYGDYYLISCNDVEDSRYLYIKSNDKVFEYSANGRPLVTVEKSTQYAKQVHLTKKLNTVGSPF